MKTRKAARRAAVCTSILALLLVGATAFAVQPTANDDSDSTSKNVAVSTDVLFNDSNNGDPDILTVTAQSNVATPNGIVSCTSPECTYTPGPDFVGIDSYSYEVCDNEATPLCDTATVTIDVINNPPTADAQPVTTDEDTPVAITLTGSDLDGDSLTFAIGTGPTQGVLSGAPPNVTYSPNADANGADSFTFTVFDGGLTSAEATVSITVTPINDEPTADDQPVTTDEDTSVAITLTGSDPEGSPLTFAIGTGPTIGALSGTPPNVTYTPNAGVSGADSFTFTVFDDSLTSAEATVSITVSSVNDAPTADDQLVTTDEDTPVAITLTGSDPEGSPLTFAIGTGPAQGVLSGSPPNVTYTPSADANGADSFTFTAFDGGLTSAEATVSITVSSVNDAPTADDQLVTTDEDTPVAITLTGSDPEGSPLTFAIGTGPTQGVLGGTPPNVTYTPNTDVSGADSFTFTVFDGSLTSAEATVSITVSSVNDAPVAVDDGPFPLDEGGTIAGTINVLDNDTDLENDVLSAVEITPPVNAAAFVLNSDGTFTYTHDGSETLTDSFTYQANDGSPSNTATVSLTINPVNDPPTFGGLVTPLTTPEDTTLTIVIQDLVILDPDNVPAEFTLVLDPLVTPVDNYTLAGATSITPAENFNGVLSVRATVSDGLLTSPTFVIPVDVTPENDLPVLVAPIGPNNAIEDAAFNLDISGNFSDADGDTLNYTATWLPAKPPNINFNGATGLFSGTPRLVDTELPGPVYQVTVTATDPGNEFVSDTFELTISALGRANLQLLIGVTPDTGLPGDELRWTFTSRNPVGPVAGESVELAGSFVGTGLTVLASGGSCTIAAEVNEITSFVCVLGSIPVGASTSTVITTSTSQASEVIAFGTVAGTETVPIDPNLDDNSAIEAAGVADAFSVGAVQFLGNATIRSVAAGDINGDGETDLVVGTAAGQPVQIYFNAAPRESCQCLRDFLTAPISVPDTGSNEGVALGHFNADNFLDLVVANGGGQLDRVYLNDGAGNFAEVLPAPLGASFAQDVAVGDFDNDGDTDIAIAANGGNPVYLGNGNGGFNLHATLGSRNSVAVAVARFDNNNRDDLVFANVSQSSTVWTKNSGNGFTLSDQLNIGDAVAVAAADLGGNGQPDLVFGRVPNLVGNNPQNPDTPSNPVLINDGTGNFGNPSALLGISPTNDVHIGDVNQDGSPDLVFVGASGVHQIWTANGGGYSLHREQIIDGGAMTAVLVELGDTDDGDPGGVDLAMGGASQGGIAVYLNDSFGNLGRGDAVPPVLTLLGDASVSVAAKSSYSDAGATAVDNIDGDISRSIAVSGAVNISTVGNYTLTYNVTDFAGNAAATITRTVTVTPSSGSGGGGGGAISIFTLLSLLIGTLISLRSRATRSTRQKVV